MRFEVQPKGYQCQLEESLGQQRGLRESQRGLKASQRGLSALEPVREPPSKLGQPLRNLQRWDSLGSSLVSLGASWEDLRTSGEPLRASWEGLVSSCEVLRAS